MRYLLSLVVLTSCGGSEAPATPAETPAAKPAASGYQGSDTVADAGTITGSVSYAGDKTDRMLTPDKDLETCGHEHPERAANELVVADGKLANVVIYLPDVSAGKNWDSETVTVDNVECMFEPHVAIGKKGGKVAAKNSDPVLHNTNLTLTTGKKKIANIALPQQGQVIEKTLKKSGLVDVKCDAHSWMQGWVFVTENPYATVSGADGSFTLSDVPAGDYTAKVWHELLGEQEASVTVAAGGTATLEIAYN